MSNNPRLFEVADANSIGNWMDRVEFEQWIDSLEQFLDNMATAEDNGEY